MTITIEVPIIFKLDIEVRVKRTEEQEAPKIQIDVPKKTSTMKFLEPKKKVVTKKTRSKRGSNKKKIQEAVNKAQAEGISFSKAFMQENGIHDQWDVSSMPGQGLRREQWN